MNKADQRAAIPVRISRLSEQGEEADLDNTTVEERLRMMWQLALDAWAFMGEPVEAELQGHVVRILRGGRDCTGA